MEFEISELPKEDPQNHFQLWNDDGVIKLSEGENDQ